MVELTRKYPVKQKTTTKEGKREYNRLLMRDFRRRKKAEETHHKLLLSHLKDIIAEKNYLRKFAEHADKIMEQKKLLEKVTGYTIRIQDYIADEFSDVSLEVTQTNVNQ